MTFDGLGYSAYGVGPLPESKSRLEALLKANNSQNCVIYSQRRFHNHLPHHLIAAYFLGANPQQLTDIYEAAANAVFPLEPWEENKADALTDDDWKNHLSEKRSARRLFEYFTDKIEVESGGDWHDLVKKYLVEDNLCKGLQGGLGHALIHLANAIEMNNEYVAVEALTLCSTEFLDIHACGSGEKVPKSDLLTVFNEFDTDPEIIASQNATYEEALVNPRITEYYAHRLDFSDRKKMIKEMLEFGALTLSACRVKENGEPIFDFFLLHILTTAHYLAETILSSKFVLPEKTVTGLMQELWISWLALYSRIEMPGILRSRITDYPLESVESAWKKSIDLAVNGALKNDVHYVKAVRSLLFAETFTQNKTGFYARACLKFAEMHKPDDYLIYRLKMKMN